MNKNNLFKMFEASVGHKLNDELESINARINDIAYGEVKNIQDLNALVRSLMDEVAEFIVQWNDAYQNALFE